MNYQFKLDFSKQTALLLFCGLLPLFCLAQQRSKSDAIIVAKDFVNSKTFEKGTTEIKLQQLSSSVSLNYGLKEEREAYYIFSADANNAGFVIVSGDERMPAILAYSDEDDFKVNNIPPNVRYWLDCYTEAFLALDNSDNSNNSPNLRVNSNGVTPLIENNKWGQSNPYNRLCPSVNHEKCVTGCVSTAMAQVMNFHGYPSVGKGIISYNTETNNIHIQHDLSSIHFKWENMLDDYSGKYTSEQADAVAELLYSCGVSVRMDYCTSKQGGSGAYQKDLITAYVNNFNYDKDAAFMARGYCSLEDWHRLLMRELDEGRPVNYAGTSIRDGGHSFVLDGYKFSEGNKYPDYHVNWGWNGSCNGYYQIADLQPVEDGQYATNGGFNSSQQMTIGIKPEDGIDDESCYLCTPALHTSSSTAKVGNKIKVYTTSCANFSYKAFNGSLYVALIPSVGGEEIILGEYKVRTLEYLQELNNLNIEITLPLNLPEGQYTVQLRSKQSKKDKYNNIISKSYSVITISDGGGENPVIADDATLGCSELELQNNSDSTLISLNIYELQNLNEDPFIGDLRMIIADKYGELLFAFGDSIQTGELSMYEIQDEPLRINGTLSANLPDGEYKIFVGARKTNSSDYVYVSSYDIANPEINYQDMYLDAKIKNGYLIINDRVYKILPTSIKNVEIMPNTNNGHLVYLIDGTCVGEFDELKQSLLPGVYIIRQNGKTKKLIISH